MPTVFIIGSKGIPAQYGGFETFVDCLTARSNHPELDYYVACLTAKETESYEHNGAHCLRIRVPRIGSARGVIYDLLALRRCYQEIRRRRLNDCTIYILASRIGPFLGLFRRFFESAGVRILINPDGHEWKRARWNAAIRLYWKISERFMVRSADLVVCDSREIQKYIRTSYARYTPRTVFIPYGAELSSSGSPAHAEGLDAWLARHELKPNEFYLVVGRFVPENNYEIILREFRRSSSSKRLVFISNFERNRFYERLRRITAFERDDRILFAGTEYEKLLLRQIRESAFAYIHGHEVGGTNPSLVEALASTRVNLVHDVSFNREVAGAGAIYYTKATGSLAAQIEWIEAAPEEVLGRLGETARARVQTEYNWPDIIRRYEELFLNPGPGTPAPPVVRSGKTQAGA